MALTHDDVLKIPRGDLKYALFRVRAGNPGPQHSLIFEYYAERLEQYALLLHMFGEEGGWDLDKKDPRNIVSGHVVRVYRTEMQAITDLEGRAVPKAPVHEPVQLTAEPAGLEESPDVIEVPRPATPKTKRTLKLPRKPVSR